MEVQTIVIPNAEEEQQIAINSKARKHNTLVVPTNQKLAAVMLSLAGAVTKSDYPALAANIKAITGITDVKLLVDVQTPATIATGTELRVVADVQLRIEDSPA